MVELVRYRILRNLIGQISGRTGNRGSEAVYMGFEIRSQLASISSGNTTFDRRELKRSRAFVILGVGE